MSMTQSTQGIFFVATGNTCRQELRYALWRLGNSNPSIAVTVFTDKPESFEDVRTLVDRIERIDSPTFSFIDKIHGFLNAPYDRNIYMDTDTATIDDISDLFILLERFDLAASHGVGADGKRFNGEGAQGVPECFAEFNTGVVCFRRSAATHAMFQRWQALYAQNPEHVHDQVAFRQAAYESDLSLYVLAPEYNYLAGLAELSGKVKVFHSPKLATNPQAFDTFASQINSSLDVRLFLPPSKLFTLRKGTS